MCGKLLCHTGYGPRILTVQMPMPTPLKNTAMVQAAMKIPNARGVIAA